MKINFEELNYENIGIWPLPVKVFVVVAIFILILALGFWFDSQNQLSTLSKVEKQEIKLRNEFESKQQLSAGLKEYKKQIVEIEDSFGELLRQLPGKTEVPGLLEDISEKGITNGLDFKLIQPLKEEKQEFYAELPIKIKVTGNYHELAEFISDIASLPRIVTLNDFTIVRYSKGQPARGEQQGITAENVKNEDELVMEITAKTYRYIQNE